MLAISTPRLTPLQEAAVRLDAASAIVNRMTPINSEDEFGVAEVNFLQAFDAFEAELERATGIPADQIEQRLQGLPGKTLTPSRLASVGERRRALQLVKVDDDRREILVNRIVIWTLLILASGMLTAWGTYLIGKAVLS